MIRPRTPLLFTALALGLALSGCSSDEDGGDTEKNDGQDDVNVETDAAYAAASSHCVDKINEYRKTLDLPPYKRWADSEGCADAEAKSDSETGKAHGAFGKCGESAQNECPGWKGTPDSIIDGCLEMMWKEGPGEDFQKHGHYLNMSNKEFTKVACGFFVTDEGKVWSVHNYRK
jgi:hypothetical protein